MSLSARIVALQRETVCKIPATRRLQIIRIAKTYTRPFDHIYIIFTPVCIYCECLLQ